MSLSKRARRIWIFLAGFTVVVLVVAGWVNQQLEPTKLARTVLAQVDKQFELTIQFEGQPSYAFKPEPRLVLPNVQVLNPIDKKVFLSAKRLEISLPWSTVMGDTPHITRIQINQPILDFPEFRKWQATRPITPFELPTFTDGLKITDGQLIDEGYSIRGFHLSLPHLENHQPVKASVSGIFQQGDTIIKFSGPLTIADAGLQSTFNMQSDGEIYLDKKPLPYQLKIDGEFASLEKSFNITSKALRWTSHSPLPNIQANLKLSIGDQLTLDSQGTILDWPKDWPTLPAPMNQQTKNITYQINYLGKPDFSDPLALVLTVHESQFNSTLKIAEMQDWLQRAEGSPIPPLQGRFNTPNIELDGVSLEGVSIELSPDAAKQ